MSNPLLINEPPLQVLPSLAKAIGLQEALVLQQFHYWLGTSKNVHDGRKWIYNTLEQWTEQFPFWSADALRKIIKSLRDKGLIEVKKLSPNTWDKTNFYAINYEALEAIQVTPLAPAKSTASNGNPDRIEAVNFAASKRSKIPHLFTETTQENSQETTGGERAQAPAAPVFPKLDDFDAEQAERQAAAQAVEQPKAAPAAKPAKAAEPAHAIACPTDVPAEVFADFLTIRKSKRAPLTNTALAGIRREADKAGLSLADALAVCCERGWVGFRADWHSDSGALASAKTARPVAETFRERDERLARERMASFLPSIAARPVARPAAPVRPGTVIDVTPSKTFPSLEA